MRGRSLASDRRGAIALMAAAGMTALIGMSAFAIDLGLAYGQKAKLQKVADSAALAGAIVWVKTGSATMVQTTAQDVVVANGWAASIMQPVTSPTSANPSVTVSLKAPSTLTLGRVLSSATSVTTTGFSVASVVSTRTPACLVALTTMQVNGTLSTGNCAMVANSSSSQAINVNSGGSVTASSIDTPGTIGYSGGTVSGTTNTGKASDAAADPYSSFQSLEASTVSGCSSYQNYSNQTTLTPGCWQNVSINTPVTLSPGPGATPGIYVVNHFNVNSGGSVSATGAGGVVIIDTDQMNLNGNISITAPITGNWAGMAIYTNGLNFNSNVPYTINGALYSPTGILIFGSGSFSTSACTYVVAKQIISNSNSNFTLPQSSCNSAYTAIAPSVADGSKIGLTQ